jgi:protein-disulfide isomerase
MKLSRLLLSVSVMSFLTLAVSQPQAQESRFSEEEQRAIEAIVRDYILTYPEIIPEAVRILQQRQQAQRGELRLATITENRDQIENDGISPQLGNPNGDVTIVEYYDYRCPFCVRSHPNIIRLLAEDANLRVVFKQFPVKDEPGTPPVSLTAARMALAAERQGKFAEFHARAMEVNLALTIPQLFDIASQIGMDTDQMQRDMDDGALIASIRDNFAMANQLGISGTPAFVIGNDLVEGSRGYQTLRAAVDAARTAN